jgi:glycosyltransferase involved in cell wall biosynthesis
VNDGSTDKTEEIIDGFALNDSRFLKINRMNGGVSAARNTGLDAARGEYVFFIDHDDLIPRYTLKNLLHAAQKFDADMARGRMMMIAENCTLEQLPENNGQNAKQCFYRNPLTDYYRHIRGKNKKWYYVWMCLIKKSVLEDVRFLEPLRAGGEDFLFVFDVVGKTKNFVQISDIVACHRYSKISVTLNGYKPELFLNISEIVIPHIYRKYALNQNVDKRLLRWVYQKESYAVYRFLIRNLICKNNIDIKHLKQSHKFLLKLYETPEFKEILKRWNVRQRIFFRLFINEKYGVARKFKIFI